MYGNKMPSNRQLKQSNLMAYGDNFRDEQPSIRNQVAAALETGHDQSKSSFD